MQTYDDSRDAVVEEGEEQEPTTPKNEMAGDPESEGGEQPEELTPAQKVMIATKRIMWQDPKMTQGIVRTLRGEDGVANAAFLILGVLYTESQRRIPPQLLLLAVEPIVAELFELAEAVGVKVDPKTMSQIIQRVRAHIQQSLTKQGGQPQAAPQAQQQPAGAPGGGLIQQSMEGA